MEWGQNGDWSIYNPDDADFTIDPMVAVVLYVKTVSHPGISSPKLDFYHRASCEVLDHAIAIVR